MIEAALMMSRHSLCLVLLALAGGALPAAELRWPAIDGELSGVVRPDILGDAPPLAWHARLKPPANGARRLELEVTSRGLVLHAQATLLSETENAGTWQLADATIDLAPWLPVAIARAGVAALPADLVATGTLRLAGEGTWRDAEVSGALTASLENATASSVAQNWSASGFTVTGDVALAKNLPMVRSLKIGIDLFQVMGLTVHRIGVDAVAGEGRKLEVRRAEVEMLGGRVALTPFSLDLAAPSIDTTADLAGVALGDLAALLPQALTAASGQIFGRVSVRWSAAAGGDFGAGTLRVASDSLATVRLAERPGFLTQSVPSRFNLAGKSLGPVSRLLSLENPAYDTLRRIELGELPLIVDGLEMKLYPDGPDGATARINLSGHPADAKSAVGNVSFAVNVAGPLSQVLRLGMQKNASMSFGKSR